MKYFGFLKSELIKHSNNVEIANFLIENKLFSKITERKIYVFDNNNLLETENKFTVLKSSQLYFLTLYEFTKIISIHLSNQLKNDLNQLLNKKQPKISSFNSLLINEDDNFELEPTQNLLDDFYNFIISHYESKILNLKFEFFHEFKEESFGLDYNEQKRIALQHYKKKYNILFEDNIIYVPDDEYYTDENLIDFEYDFFKTQNKIKIVYQNKIKYQHKLSTPNAFFQYLIGDESIHTNSFYKKNQKAIDEAINYEALKDIMVELNSKFEFEEDYNLSTNNKEVNSIDYYNPNAKELELKNKESTTKYSKTNNTPIPFIDFIRHEKKKEIERIIKTHYSDLYGVSLRYLIEFLIEEGVLLLNYGDKKRLLHSIEILFDGKKMGAYTSVFDAKVFSKTDKNYLDAKISFKRNFKDIL